MFDQLKKGLLSLRGSPRDLYIVFILKVLESYNYFSLSRVLVLYLTEDFEIADVTAGALFGLWGTFLTLYGLFLGSAIDAYGIKKSMMTCFFLNMLARGIMSTTSSRTVLITTLLSINCIAGSLGVPVMTIAVKRFTTPLNRGFSFALFYTLMNLAALSQGLLVDVFRITFRHGFRIDSLSEHNLLNNGTRLFLFTGFITSLIGLLLTLTIKSQGSDTSSCSDVANTAVQRRLERSVAQCEQDSSPLLPRSNHGSHSTCHRDDAHRAALFSWSAIKVRHY